MLVKLYEAYGCLAREKTPVYSEFVPGSDAYYQITVNVPDEFETYETVTGEHCVMLTQRGSSKKWGCPLAECLELIDDKLYIAWSDGLKTHHQIIDVVERK